MEKTTRRQWLVAAGATGISALGSTLACSQREPRQASASAPQNTPRIPGVAESKSPAVFDAHVHVWTADTTRYPPAPGFDRSDFWFPSFSVEELLAAARPYGVTHINFVQMTWYGLDHTYIVDAIAKDPKHLVGTGVVPAVTDVGGPSPDRTMLDLAKRGVVAFRIRGKSTRPPLGDGPRWLDHPGYEKMFRTAAEHNLALSFLMGPSDIPELDRMCGRHPDAPVIIDHFCLVGRQGNFDESETKALVAMAKHRRVLLKIGAFYALGAKKAPYLDMLPLMRRVIEAFGPERCMWESDAPVHRSAPHTYGDSVAILRDHADFLSTADKEQILFKTAHRAFFER